MSCFWQYDAYVDTGLVPQKGCRIGVRWLKMTILVLLMFVSLETTKKRSKLLHGDNVVPHWLLL